MADENQNGKVQNPSSQSENQESKTSEGDGEEKGGLTSETDESTLTHAERSLTLIETSTSTRSRRSSIPRLIPLILTQDKRDGIYQEIFDPKDGQNPVSKYLNAFGFVHRNQMDYSPSAAAGTSPGPRSPIPERMILLQTKHIEGFFNNKPFQDQILKNKFTFVKMDVLKQTVEPYTVAILRFELNRESQFTLVDTGNSAGKLREKMVSFIFNYLKTQKSTDAILTPETIHLAVYIIDRLLQNGANDQYNFQVNLELYAATALMISTKLDEKQLCDYYYTPGKTITLLTNFGIRQYRAADVIRAERKILRTLEWKVFALTSNFLMEMCVEQIGFLNDFIRENSLKIASDLLLRSLCNRKMSFVAPSSKAKNALIVAAGFTMSNAQQMRYMEKSCWKKFVEERTPEMLSRMGILIKGDNAERTRTRTRKNVQFQWKESASTSEENRQRPKPITALSDITNRNSIRNASRPKVGQENAMKYLH